MNTELQTVQFDSIPLSIIDHNGEGWFTGEDVGKALEYEDPRIAIHKIFDRNRDELEEYSSVTNLVTEAGNRETRIYNEEGVMMIGFLSKQPKAVAFRKWAVKILKAYRHKELVQQDTLYLEELKSHLETQKQLALAQQDQMAHIKRTAVSEVKRMEGQLLVANNTNAYHQRVNNLLKEDLQRAIRAQRPIQPTEEKEIFEKFNSGVPINLLSSQFYRKPHIVRRAIRNQGGEL